MSWISVARNEPPQTRWPPERIFSAPGMPTEGCAWGVLESPHLLRDAGVLNRPDGAWAGFEAGPAGPGLQPAGPAARHSPPTREMLL